VADRLGHSTTAVTADIYQRVLPDLDRDAANKVAALVFDTPAQPGSSEAQA
jgi:hypothetical protein